MGRPFIRPLRTVHCTGIRGWRMGLLEHHCYHSDPSAASIGNSAIPGVGRDFGLRAIQCRNSDRRNYYNLGVGTRALARVVPVCGQCYR